MATKRDPLIYVALIIWSIYIAFLFVGPFLVVLSYSFHGRSYLGGVTNTLSLQGWRDFFSFSSLSIMLRSLLMAGINTLTCLVFGIPLSIYINRKSVKTKRVWFAALVLPMALNSLLVAYSWQVLLGNVGVINKVLIFIGVTQKPVNILFTPTAVMLGLFGSYLPFFIIAFLTSLERIETGYIIASSSLGARNVQTLLKVIFPMAKPGLVVGSLLVFLPSFAEFVIPDLLGGGKIFLVGSLTQFAFYEGRNWPMGAVAMVTTILMLSFFTIPIVRYIRGVYAA